MSKVELIKDIYEELRVLNRNLGKDNTERRCSLEVTNKYISKLEKIRKLAVIEINEFKSKKQKPEYIDDVNPIIEAIEKYIIAIDDILKRRLSSCLAISQGSCNSSSNKEIVQITMAEKFDLRTAAAIIPPMTNEKDSVLQLIDAIELYDSLLDVDSRKLLTKYVLKTRLPASAKLKLLSSYPSNEALVTDLKVRFLTKKSAATLSFELHNLQQNRKSIEDYGRKLEQLMVDLTLAQSNNNEDAASILSNANEKIAINVFANGLADNDIRVIVKARNYDKLKDAISAAQDEEIAKRGNTSHVFQVQKNRGQFRGTHRGSRNRAWHGNSNNRIDYNRHDNYHRNPNNEQSRTYRSGSHNRGLNRGNRGRNNNYRGFNTRSSYNLQSSNESEGSQPLDFPVGQPAEKFFRAPQ